MAAHRFVHHRRVEFADTDQAGIMHFSNFYRFMEVAEHAFYRSLGFTVHEFQPDGPDGPRIGWPRVHASADFRLPLEFEENVEIELLVERIGGKSITYLFRFWKPVPEGSEPLLAATGKFTVVCIQFGEGEERMTAIQIPDSIRALVEEAPAEVLNLD